MRNPFSHSEHHGRRSHAEAHFFHAHGHHHEHHRGHHHDHDQAHDHEPGDERGHERHGHRGRHAHHHPFHHMMIGRRGHGPFGRGGPDFPGDERGDPRGGGRMGRMFGQGDLKLLLLALIETQPRHGYELIRAIEDLCGGAYSPSPGAIYPTLTFLEEAGYAAVQVADASARKQYAITDEGRQHLEQNRLDVEAVMQRLKLSSRMMAKLSVPETIRESMHQLRHALMGHDRAWDATEVKRVISIIEKAAKDIASP